VDSTGHLHASFRYYHWLEYAYHNGTSWQFTDVEGPALQTAIGLDGSDRPHIAYYHPPSQSLRYARLNGTDWYTETVDQVGLWNWYNPWTISLYVSPYGVVHLSYYNAEEGDLKYARRTLIPTGWDIQVVDRVGDVGMFSTLAVDDQNRPYIAYYDATNGDLKYAYLLRAVFLPLICK
jgi:hypothetical protein